MRTPVGVSLADYVAAVKADAPSHVRLTFLAQNVVLTDEDIEASGGLRLNNFLNGDTDLVMGKAVMSSIEVSIFNTSKVDGLIWSSECKLEFGLEVGGETRWNTVGYFTGSRPEKIRSVEVISFTANDRMNRFDRLADDWVNSLTYPMTVNEMFHSLCSWCNVSYESGDELSNMLSRSYSSSPFVLEGMTCREILACIAEACGCYARINSAGNCQMIWFSDHTSDYTVNENDEFPPVEIFDFTEGKKWKDLEDFKWKDLESLTWADLGGTKSLFEVNALSVVSSFYETNVVVPSATNGNTYTIVDNPFLTFASAAEKTAYIVPIYNRLYAFGGYIPLKVNCLGNALVEAGDVINVVVDGTTIVLPIFCKTVMFNGALTDSYETTGQIVRDEVTPEVKAKIAEGAKYSLVMEEIELTARNKYDIQSGIDIKPEGIEIDASKHLKLKSGSEIDIDASGNLKLTGSTVEIKSGSTFDVDATNFKISSSDEKMVCGDWTFDNNGCELIDTIPYQITNASNWQSGKGGIYWYTSNSQGILRSFIELMPTMKESDNNYIYPKFRFYTYKNLDNSIWARLDVLDVSEFMLFEDKPAYSIRTNRITNIQKIASAYDENILFTLWKHVTDGLYYNYIEFGLSANNEATITGGHLVITCKTLNYTNLVQSSSKDIKHNIQPLPSIGDRLDTLKPVTFVYDNDENEKQRMGLIYEDTVETMPEICTNDESDKAINYVELIPALLKEIQDLRARVKQLEERGVN